MAALQVLAIMARVNSYFQQGNLPEAALVANNDWTGGVYLTGNMAHFRASHNASLLEYARRWGDAHDWKPAGYSGCHGTLGCPDNIICGQGFADVYGLTEPKNDTLIAATAAALDIASRSPCEVATNSSQAHDSDKCWWWVDALFMALPVYARMGSLAATPADAERIWAAGRAQYNVTAFGVNSTGAPAFGLWSPEESLFYRDDSYLDKKAANGKGVFWSRGNGWAFGAMALTLDALPSEVSNTNDTKNKTSVLKSRLARDECFGLIAHRVCMFVMARCACSQGHSASVASDRAEYTSKLVAMAAKVKLLQGQDGCWRSSLLDAEQFPMIETSGSSLFVFGLAWGINRGVLPAADYRAAAMKGWECLNQPSPVRLVCIY
jgi:rhamnogalacturonyl hydrolase YesR